MTSATGQEAESAVARYLSSKGYKILQRNWRTKFCEIDIVAQKGGVVYFVEVKYRVQSSQGQGLDYITFAKQKRMRRAAIAWAQSNDWSGDIALLAAEVGGLNYEHIELTEVE